MLPSPTPLADDAPLREAMRRLAQGDRDAFRPLAAALQPRLTRLFLQLGVPHHDCDDLIQETSLRIFRAAPDFDPARPFMPWAITIARRVMFNWFRDRKATVPLHLAPEPAAPLPSPGQLAQSDLWAFARAVLPPDQHELLWFRYGEALTSPEIAAATGRTAIHIRVLLHRARAALAHALEKETRLTPTKRSPHGKTRLA